MTSQPSFSRRQSLGRRVPHRPTGKRRPAVSSSQLAALGYGDWERRLEGEQAPCRQSLQHLFLAAPSNEVLPGLGQGANDGCQVRRAAPPVAAPGPHGRGPGEVAWA